MIHDPSHSPVIPQENPILLSQADKDILKKLGEKIALIASDPQNAQNIKNWKLLNDKKSVRPMVWINEVPWHEMNVNDELTLYCENPWARDLEQSLKRTIYQWNHFRGDMVVNPYIECPLAIHSTDFGIVEKADTAYSDKENDVYSRHFIPQITNPEDIEKIKMPVITHYEKATQNAFDAMSDIFDGIIPVKKIGQTHIWYTPWDYLIRWWGVEQAMMDLVLRPQMVHDIYERMVQAWMTELDQFEQQQLLSLDNSNIRVGSGGYGYTDDLPDPNSYTGPVTAKQMWGCSNAQILSSVSEQMHWEFAIEHDLKWLERFGLVYYGCCEPLDKKINILRRIKNLRKISVSPWCDSRRAIDEIGSDYVISRKPNPAVLAVDFDEREIKKQLCDFLDMTQNNCHVEIIMKDISTVGRHPQRLWDWETVAMETVMKYVK
ncbi:MAG: hypothetical protein ACI4F7_04060 [Acutalibacteraceae bacterium]